MDILKKSLSISRYAILGSHNTPREKTGQANWTEYAFASIDHTPEEQAFGLVSLQDYEAGLQTPLTLGDYTFLRLRIDTRRIPPAVLKRRQDQVLARERAILSRQGKKRISWERRNQLRQKVRQELLWQTEPTPKTIGLVLAPGELWAMTVQECELHIVEQLMGRLLAATLLPVELCLAPHMQHRELAKEFLSTLYRLGRINKEQASARGLSNVWLARSQESITLRTQSQMSWPELSLGLSRGARINQADLELRAGSETYTFQLRPNWSVSRLKVPALQGSLEDRLLQKAGHLQQVFRALDSLGLDALGSKQGLAA